MSHCERKGDDMSTKFTNEEAFNDVMEIQEKVMKRIDAWISEALKTKRKMRKAYYVKQKLGISISTYNRYLEPGNATQVSLGFLLKASKLMHISVDELLAMEPVATLDEEEEGWFRALKASFPSVSNITLKNAGKLIVELIHLPKK